MDSTEGSDVMQADIETEENSISVTQEGDYKQMYNECNRKLAEVTEQFQKKLFNITTEYEVLKQDHKEYEKTISDRKNTENENSTILSKHIPNSPGESPCTSRVTIHLNRVGSNEDIFRTRSKKKGVSKNTNIELTKCEYSCCDQENVDLVKCNNCNKWVCELCNDVPVLKLKAIMNKCNTVYFVCKSCDIMLTDNTENTQIQKTKNYTKISNDNKILQQQNKQLRDQTEVLYKSLEEREEMIQEAQIKAKSDTTNQPINDLQKLINERFDKIEENIDNLITKKITENTQIIDVKEIQAQINSPIHQNKSYAASLQTTLEANNITNIIRETKNEELVNKKQRELRSANLIIYGVREELDNQIDLKGQDEQFITSFLDTIGLTLKPKQIIRLGKPNEDKKRPIKLVMNNVTDKDNIMARLGNLKNAEDIYHQLSVRDDYIIEERNQIKEWVKKADQKNRDENTQAWKVRGSPKNGLRLVKTTKRR